MVARVLLVVIHGCYGVIRGLRIVARVLWLLGCY